MRLLLVILILQLLIRCGHKECCPSPPSPTPVNFSISSWSVNSIPSLAVYYNVNRIPTVKIKFGTTIDKNTVSSNIFFKDNSGTPVNCSVSYENADSTVVLQPSSNLNFLAKYKVS